jgi:di/tricarboxylate transporter
MIIGLIGPSGARRTPLPDVLIKEGDVLLLEGEPEALDKMVAQGGLVFSERRDAKVASKDSGTVEAVIGRNSDLIGRSAQDLTLFDRTGLNLLAVSRSDKRFTERLGQIKFENGDVIVLQGDPKGLPDFLRQWDCLPLVERGLKLGSVRNGLVPVFILAAAMASTALGLVSVPVAFFAAAMLMVVSRTIPLREVYSHLDAPILIMLAALIPVSNSLRTTGGTDLIADWLSETAAVLPPYGALALIMVAAMAVTPFLNNAATVLVMAPIAATFATDLGFRPEAFLMAVAIGAGSDFLTPIGHQCNTLVMGPGGYRFGDYWRLGLPLSILVVIVSVPMLMLVWPF